MENEIHYRLSFSVNEDILELVISGELTKQSIEKLHAEVIRTIGENKASAVLCDIRGLKGPQEFTAAFFRARSIPSEVQPLPLAVVEHVMNGEYQEFYEMTSANAGHLVKWFDDPESARSWLKGKVKEVGGKQDNDPRP